MTGIDVHWLARREADMMQMSMPIARSTRSNGRSGMRRGTVGENWVPS